MPALRPWLTVLIDVHARDERRLAGSGRPRGHFDQQVLGERFASEYHAPCSSWKHSSARALGTAVMARSGGKPSTNPIRRSVGSGLWEQIGSQIRGRTTANR